MFTKSLRVTRLPLLILFTLTLFFPGTAWGQSHAPRRPLSGGLPTALQSLAVVSSKDIWAVGYYSSFQTLTEHWNGKTWSVVPSANPSKDFSLLHSVSAVSHNDIWAVGETSPGIPSQTLVEHWNGTTWSVVPSPNSPLGTDSYLVGVATRSQNDVWAVGYYSNLGMGLSGSPPSQPLIEHWNGKVWSIISSPSIALPNNINALTGVTALSATNVWAVGSSSIASRNPTSQTLIEHWDGKTWSIVSSPSSVSSSDLQAIAAISSKDMWAVGSLIEHWNGKTWSIVPSPSTSPLAAEFFGVSALSSHDVWAVGDKAQNISASPLIEHWNGKAWSIVPSPSAPPSGARLFAVKTVSEHEAWAVGDYFSTLNGLPLIEHWNGKVWSIA